MSINHLYVPRAPLQPAVLSSGQNPINPLPKRVESVAAPAIKSIPLNCSISEPEGNSTVTVACSLTDEMKRARSLTDEVERARALMEISYTYVTCEDFERARIVANMIEGGNDAMIIRDEAITGVRRMALFRRINKIAVTKENIPLCLDVAQREALNFQDKTFVLMQMAIDFVGKGISVKEVRRVLKNLPDKQMNGLLLLKMMEDQEKKSLPAMESLSSSASIQECLTVNCSESEPSNAGKVNVTVNFECRIEKFKYFSEEKIDGIIRIACSFKDEVEKARALQSISNGLMYREDFKKATDVLNRIEGGNDAMVIRDEAITVVRRRALSCRIKEVVKREKNISLGIDIARQEALDEPDLTFLLMGMARHFAREKRSDEEIREIIQNIPNEQLRDETLEDIAQFIKVCKE